MPPRISGSRVSHAMVDGHGKVKPYNPSPKHPGFKAVQAGIARRQHISSDKAGAILAAGARRASASAKKKNPRLKKVKS